MKAAFTLVAVTSVVAVANAQLNTSLVGSVGLYYPSARETRQLFGDVIVPVGIGPGKVQRPSEGKFTPDFSALSASNDGNKFFLLSLAYGYEVHMAEKTSSSVPYARIAAGGTYYDYSFNRTTGHFANKTFGGTAYGEVGIVFNERTSLSARYSFFQKKDDLDFSGLGVSVGLRF